MPLTGSAAERSWCPSECPGTETAPGCSTSIRVCKRRTIDQAELRSRRTTGLFRQTRRLTRPSLLSTGNPCRTRKRGGTSSNIGHCATIDASSWMRRMVSRSCRDQSRAGGHECGQDVVGVAVEVLASSVVAHGGTGVGMTRGGLDVSEVYSCVEHRGDEGVAEHVGMHPGDRDAGREGEPLQSSGRDVAGSCGCSSRLRRMGPQLRSADGAVDGSGDCWREGREHDLVALPVNLQDAVPMELTEVLDVGRRWLRRSGGRAVRAC